MFNNNDVGFPFNLGQLGACLMTDSGGFTNNPSNLSNYRPRAYTRPRELTPNIRRWMLARGWIDHRVVTRIERPDPAHVALLYRIREIEQAPGPGVDVRG